MKRKCLWPTVWGFTHSHVNTWTKYLLLKSPFHSVAQPEVNSYLTEILQYHTEVLTGSLRSLQSIHCSLQRVTGAQGPHLPQVVLISSENKSPGRQRQKKGRTEMTSVTKQNCQDKVKQKRRAMRSVFIQLQKCWLLKLSQELLALGFPFSRPETMQSLSFPEKQPVKFNRHKHIYLLLDDQGQELLSFLYLVAEQMQ